ncbi:hypothetical protein LINPERPRIM_LOCUS40707 [Linum perenne]
MIQLKRLTRHLRWTHRKIAKVMMQRQMDQSYAGVALAKSTIWWHEPQMTKLPG